MSTQAWSKMHHRMDKVAMNRRVQDEAQLANQIMKQYPDVSRDEALRVAARIVD